MEKVYKRDTEAAPIKIQSADKRQTGENENADCGNIIFIPVKSVLINPFMAKQTYSARTLERLRLAILHDDEMHPIYVRSLKTELYELIAGEKWLTAAKIAGLEMVPAIVFRLEDGESALKHLLRWPKSAELHFLEEAEACRMLIDSGKYAQSDLGDILGRSQSYISNKLRLLKLSPQLRRQIMEAGISERHARELLKLTDEKLQQLALKKITESKLSVQGTEKLIAGLQKNHDLLGWFLYENRNRFTADAGGKKKEEIFVRGNNVKNMKQIISIMKELVFCAREYGLIVHAGQRSTDTAVEFLLKVPKRENGINLRKPCKTAGIIEIKPQEAETEKEAA